MAIDKRTNREIVDQGIVTHVVTNDDIGKTLDIAGLISPFRVLNVNVTVEEAFTNANNTIKVGIEGDDDKFISSTAINAIKGIGFSNVQFTAVKPTAILATIAGSASASGKAVVTITYAKTASSRVEY